MGRISSHDGILLRMRPTHPCYNFRVLDFPAFSLWQRQAARQIPLYPILKASFADTHIRPRSYEHIPPHCYQTALKKVFLITTHRKIHRRLTKYACHLPLLREPPPSGITVSDELLADMTSTLIALSYYVLHLLHSIQFKQSFELDASLVLLFPSYHLPQRIVHVTKHLG